MLQFISQFILNYRNIPEHKIYPQYLALIDSIKLILLYILFLRWAIWPMDFIFFFTNLVNCRLNNCIWVFWIMRVHYAYTVYIWKAIWIKLYVLIFLSFCTRARKCNYNARAIKVEQCMCWGPDWDCFCVLFN